MDRCNYSVYLRNKSWKPECVGILTWIDGY